MKDNKMEDVFAIANVLPGKLNALVKNIMKQTGTDDPNEAVRLVNAGMVKILLKQSKFKREGIIIYLSVVSEGISGKEWISRLESKGVILDDCVKNILLSKDFQPTSGTYEVAILKDGLFDGCGRTTKNIRQIAKNLEFATPNLEIACLVRESLSTCELEALGIKWLLIMHKPVNHDGLKILSLSYDRTYSRDYDVLGTSCGCDNFWADGGGFVFVANQTSDYCY